MPGNVHVAMVPPQEPSQTPTPPHVRVPWGAPLTVVQVPSLPATSHASQGWSHSRSQHAPSEQMSERQLLAVAQAPPFARFAAHLPALQNAPVAHSASFVQVATGQLPLVPSQRVTHELVASGRLPLGLIVQVPIVDAHVSQALTHALSQQTPPGAQNPLVQSELVLQAVMGAT